MTFGKLARVGFRCDNCDSRCAICFAIDILNAFSKCEEKFASGALQRQGIFDQGSFAPGATPAHLPRARDATLPPRASSRRPCAPALGRSRPFRTFSRASSPAMRNSPRRFPDGGPSATSTPAPPRQLFLAVFCIEQGVYIVSRYPQVAARGF